MAKISEYLRVGEAANLLGVSKDSLRRWDRAGKLIARRHPISKYRLYLRGDLDAFLRRIDNETASKARTRKDNQRPRRQAAK